MIPRRQRQRQQPQQQQRWQRRLGPGKGQLFRFSRFIHVKSDFYFIYIGAQRNNKLSPPEGKIFVQECALLYDIAVNPFSTHTHTLARTHSGTRHAQILSLSNDLTTLATVDFSRSNKIKAERKRFSLCACTCACVCVFFLSAKELRLSRGLVRHRQRRIVLNAKKNHCIFPWKSRKTFWFFTGNVFPFIFFLFNCRCNAIAAHRNAAQRIAARALCALFHGV